MSNEQPHELPPGRCPRHADAPPAEPCAACMRAQQLRLAAHNAASAAAAQDWQERQQAGGGGAPVPGLATAG